MKLKIVWIATLFIALSVQLGFAQELSITGTVVDPDGLPLPGASIKVKGSSNGTSTDFDGNYTISAAAGDILVFSYVGFNDTEVTVGTETTIDITLEIAAQSLDEVVVIGYGEKSKRNVTTAISSVDGEDMQKIATANLSAALQGNTAGVQINQNSGAPGGEVNVRVRGATSLNGSNNPLYIVDGVPIESTATLSDNFGGQQNSALSSINPNDIESIEVLKDAAAAAIYGSRASNGVILITTKSGKEGKPRISINSYVGVQNPLNTYKLADYGEWLNFGDDYWNESQGAGYWTSYWDGTDTSGMSADELASYYNSVAGQGDDYMDMVYNDNAIVQSLSASVSGGTEKTKYYFGGSNYEQEGVLLGQNYKRNSFKLNLSQDFTDKFRMKIGATLADEDQAVVNGDNNIYGVLSTAILEAPGNSVYNEDGSYTSGVWNFSNPVQNALENQATLNTFRVLANAEFQYDFTDWMMFSSKYGLDNMQMDEKDYDPADSASGQGSNGSAREDVSTIRRFTTTQSLVFNPKISENVTFNGLLATEYTDRQYKYVRAATTNFPSTEFQEVSSGSTLSEALGASAQNKLYSVIGRASFEFYNKFILDASMRADGSSKFGPNNKWGYFPSVSAGYIMSEENWFQNNTVSFLKIRGSYGVTGNDTALGAYDYLATIASSPYGSNAGLAYTALGNPDLKWETTAQLDLGLSVSFFDNKLSLEYDYFDKRTDDLILEVPTPGSTGMSSYYGNVGAMKNTGHEFQVSYRIFDTADFSWKATASLSTLDNEVTSLGGTSPFTTGLGVSRVEEGTSVGAFYVLQSDGLYQSDDEVPEAIAENYGVGAGDVKYVDQNGDGLINSDDYVIGGSPWADFTYSLKSSLRYKNWDLDFLFSGSQGNDVFNYTLRYTGSSSSYYYGKFENQLNYWSEDNTSSNLPAPNYATSSYNNQVSTRFIEDGSYIKLRNVTLGYTLPKIMDGLDSVRFYVSADNLLLITDYSGLDPEVNYSGSSSVTQGVDFLTQGGNKAYKLGVNINF